MQRVPIPYWSLATVIFLACVLACPAETPGVLPSDRALAPLEAGRQWELISPLEVGSFVVAGGDQMQNRGWRRADLDAQLGADALVFYGDAESESAWGSFNVREWLPGELLAVGGWVHLDAGANVREVGFQVYDKDNEALIWLVPADWTGWKWIEAPLTAEAFKPTSPQEGQNGAPDQPFRSLHLVWRAKHAGKSEVTFDGIVAKRTRPQNPGQMVSIELLGPVDVPMNAPYGGSMVLTNPTARDAEVQIVLSLQRDGKMYATPLPDPVDGSDHALAARSWTVADGKTIAENTLTDGLDYTAAGTDNKKDYWSGADQYVELDRIRKITAMGWLSGDANWVAKVDVLASTDGQTFTPVPELQGIDLYKQWGRKRFPAFAPFDAKVIQLHYHKDGEKTNVIRMPSALFVWDGVSDEQLELPQAGEEVQRLTMTERIPAGEFKVVSFQFDAALPTGQYLLASKLTGPEYTKLDTRYVFVEPAWLDGVDETSKFGLNASNINLAEELRRLGIGWVRFENFKWPMVSPAPHEFLFTGLAPWNVDVDYITARYRDAGLHVLPMMFLAPNWACDIPESVPQSMRVALPPRNFEDFGEFAFQSVARYGSAQVDPSLLKTPDKVSGLNRIQYYELGNEPNLNPLRDPERFPTWGPWAGTMRQWWDLWRYGAEAIKQADPNAKVPSPGFAGMTAEIVDQMRSYTYPDGKCPLDYIDMLSVHFYSGRTPPERATHDVNNAQGYPIAFEELLKRLVDWRDRYKPGIPIWMTETGYDTGGPIGTNEWTQAARLPRVVALCLANGLDKVIVYRETGSTPAQHAGAGVLRNDLTRKPSWYTYATLIRQLQPATPEYRLNDFDDNVWVQSWRRDGKPLLMAYCVTGEGTLGIELGAATVTDAFGGVTQVTSTRNLPLNEYPVYINEITDETELQLLTEKARQREQQRKAQREADARRKMYLFNFGDPLEPVVLDFGQIRYYTPVPADSLYTPEKGYGFLGEGATRNDYVHWVRSDIEKYMVKFDKDQAFQFDVKPGAYTLYLNAKPWGTSADLILDGVEGGPRNLTFKPGEEGENVALRVTVTQPKLTLKGTYQHHLRWLILEEAQ